MKFLNISTPKLRLTSPSMQKYKANHNPFQVHHSDPFTKRVQNRRMHNKMAAASRKQNRK